ncbi:MAG: hypothetical protein WCJ24_03245 [Candidatus Saccharibacteria bacterium]
MQRESRTDIHLVPNFRSALNVANMLGAGAVAIDLEGVLGNYVGNEPYEHKLDDFLKGHGEINMGHAYDEIHEHTDVAFGIVTNNTNIPNADGEGLVTKIADKLEIPFVHKGMKVGGVIMRSKPSGDTSTHFCKTSGSDPKDAVLIDDQGVKNAGEAVKAGLKAIIVPDPIGIPRGHRGKVKEHNHVRRLRLLEPMIYRSFDRQGQIAKLVYRNIAGIDISSIGYLYDHRR